MWLLQGWLGFGFDVHNKDHAKFFSRNASLHPKIFLPFSEGLQCCCLIFSNTWNFQNLPPFHKEGSYTSGLSAKSTRSAGLLLYEISNIFTGKIISKQFVCICGIASCKTVLVLFYSVLGRWSLQLCLEKTEYWHQTRNQVGRKPRLRLK